MKKILLMAIMAIAVLIPAMAMAAQIETGDSLTLKEDQTIEDNYLIFGNFITIKGNVKGDLIAFGSNVIIEGNVDGNVYTGAGNVKVSGAIGKDLFVGAGNVEISPEAIIGNDLFIGAGNADLSGTIGRNLMIGSGKAEIKGNIGGDVQAGVDEIVFSPESPAIIEGNFTYYREKEAAIPDEIIINGDINFKEVSKNKKVGLLAIAGGHALGIAMAAIAGLILVLLFPKKSLETVKTMRQTFWSSLGIGFIILVVVPVAAIILFASILGIPIAMILIGAYILTLYISKIFTALFAGRLLTGENWHPFWSLALGLILISILKLIPIAGQFIYFVLFLAAIGAAAMTCKKGYGEMKNNL